MFYPSEIIAKKRDGLPLTKEEIHHFVKGITSKEVADYQATALLMAIYLNGFDKRETADLTNAMLTSGQVFEFEEDNIIDKHSTGGVGDKASFILAPIAAACGVKVPMVAGRGLGHTGGTIDKIESLKGFKTSLDLATFKKYLCDHDLVLMGQTDQLAPADKKLYSLRDVTATIDCIPLITASIMSKKLAEGAKGVVMDIKVGNGAFMDTKTRARKLAKSLCETGLRFNRHMMSILSDMNQPLGNAIGNSLEIIESIDTLKGQGPKDLEKLSLHIAGGMIYLGGKAKSHQHGIKQAKEALKSGAALKKFEELLSRQGADPNVITNYHQIPIAKNQFTVKATSSGYLNKMDCKAIGMHCVSLGAGRAKTSDPIDFATGIKCHVQLGQKIKKGQELFTLYFQDNQQEEIDVITDNILNLNLKLSPVKKDPPPLIYESKIYFAGNKVRTT